MPHTRPIAALLESSLGAESKVSTEALWGATKWFGLFQVILAAVLLRLVVGRGIGAGWLEPVEGAVSE